MTRHLCKMKFLLLLLALPASASGATVHVAATLDVTSSVSLFEIATDDVFLLTLTYDDSKIDSDASTDTGIFGSSLLTADLVRLSGSGSWDPALISFTLPNLVVTSSAGVTFVAGAGGSPTIGGDPFQRIQMTVSAPVNDTGGGQMLRDQLGGVIPPDAPLAGIFQFEVPDGPAITGTLTTFDAAETVPEPATWTLAGAALAALATIRAGRRCSSR